MSSNDDEFIDLTRPNFLRGSLAAAERHVIEQEFSSYVTDVIHKINDGKEATVYLCRARSDVVGVDHLAAKMYRARKFRAFASDAKYVNTAKMRDRRMAKAIRQHTAHGRHAAHHLWVDREWQMLELLHHAGASVPKPVARCDGGILMEYLGVELERAPSLAETRLIRDEAERVFHLVVRDIETMLRCGVIHGDLSAYNILYLDDRPRLIDLPQATCIDDAPDPWALFHRDVTNVADHFQRRGVTIDALDLALRLWRA
jgi:RIO kinase 1